MANTNQMPKRVSQLKASEQPQTVRERRMADVVPQPEMAIVTDPVTGETRKVIRMPEPRAGVPANAAPPVVLPNMPDLGKPRSGVMEAAHGTTATHGDVHTTAHGEASNTRRTDGTIAYVAQPTPPPAPITLPENLRIGSRVLFIPRLPPQMAQMVDEHRPGIVAGLDKVRQTANLWSCDRWGRPWSAINVPYDDSRTKPQTFYLDPSEQPLVVDCTPTTPTAPPALTAPIASNSGVT